MALRSIADQTNRRVASHVVAEIYLHSRYTAQNVTQKRNQGPQGESHKPLIFQRNFGRPPVSRTRHQRIMSPLL